MDLTYSEGANVSNRSIVLVSVALIIKLLPKVLKGTRVKNYKGYN